MMMVQVRCNETWQGFKENTLPRLLRGYFTEDGDSLCYRVGEEKQRKVVKDDNFLKSSKQFA